MPPSRRALLRSASLLAAGAAGCAALDRPTPSVVGEVRVTNRDRVPHQVGLLIEAGDEVVYWDAERVEATDPDERYRGAPVVAGTTFDGLPDEPGPYALTVRIDDQPPSAWLRYDTRDDPAACIGIAVDIGGIGTDPGEGVLLTTNNPTVCGG